MYRRPERKTAWYFGAEYKIEFYWLLSQILNLVSESGLMMVRFSV